jgi:PH (Pleckstrin Homology) domain-containing protein
MDDVPDAAAPSAPVSAVPRRMRVVCALSAAVIVVVMAVAGLALSSSNGVVNYRTSDQVAMVGLGFLLGAGVLALGRSRVDADPSGVRVRNLAVTHELPWQAVRAVRFERTSAWASLLLENGDEVSMHAIQAFDKEHAVRAVEGLRRLHAAARAKDPKPPPLLYGPGE